MRNFPKAKHTIAVLEIGNNEVQFARNYQDSG
jgi:hypothetical protein